ncbi:MAG: Flp pilus assembly protein CpaB [Candidatus Omnitrophota bacterium]
MIALTKQQKIILAAGVLLALAAVIMTKVYIDRQRQDVTEQAKKAIANIQANQSAVLVAKADIPKGVAIEPDMLEPMVVPNQYLQPQAVTSLDRISGMVTTQVISKREQITLGKLSYPASAAAGGGLAGLTPFGKRAVTISVDNIAALAGLIKPGDYVDVIAIVPIPVQTPEGQQVQQLATLPLFQNILVLAVGKDIGAPTPGESRYAKAEEKQEASSLITLAFSPQEANIAAFVQEQGKIRLILRSPADSQIEQIQPVSWDTLLQYVLPKDAARDKPPAEEKPAAGTYIDIYRGLNKERILISR